jgi:hypothetical protein
VAGCSHVTVSRARSSEGRGEEVVECVVERSVADAKSDVVELKSAWSRRRGRDGGPRRSSARSARELVDFARRNGYRVDELVQIIESL